MLNAYQVSGWYLFIAIVLWAFQRLTQWSTRLNIFSLFLVFLGLRHALTVPFDHTVNQWYAGIDVTSDAYTRYYWSLVLLWVCTLLGVGMGRIWFGSIGIEKDE